MKIYIDESGAYSIDKKQQAHSVSCVAALVIPFTKENDVFRFFEQWKTHPSLKNKLDKNGEVKGSKLNEADFKSFLLGLANFDLMLEVDIIDLGLTSDIEVEKHQSAMASSHANSVTGRKTNAQFSRDIIASLSLPNYVQMLSTSTLIHKTLETAVNYYAQRFPQELGDFQWIFDAKDNAKVNDYENTLTKIVLPLVQTYCIDRPFSSVEGFNYSYFEKYYIEEKYVLEEYKKRRNENSSFVSVSDVMQNMHFVPSHTNLGLQMVDILANCVRRAISDRLQFDGWKYLSSLIIRRSKNAISLTRFSGLMEAKARTPLANFVNYFQSSGKQMMVPDSLVGSDKLKNGYSRWCILEEIPKDTEVKKIIFEGF